MLFGARPTPTCISRYLCEGDSGGAGGHPIVRLRRNFYEIECKSTSFKLDFYQHPVVHNSTSARKERVLLAGLVRTEKALVCVGVDAMVRRRRNFLEMNVYLGHFVLDL